MNCKAQELNFEEENSIRLSTKHFEVSLVVPL